jgi:hypothetical protein
MKLIEKQQLFTKLVAQLIIQANSLGYELTLGDAYRDPRLHGEFGNKLGYGKAKSLHKLRLAIDLNLFRNGKYLTQTSSHLILGEWWEAQHSLCRWGGRFKVPDGNHYSLTHENSA